MTAQTASCFLHGYYDATLTRCPKCATDALTRRAEKAEAECGRLRAQADFWERCYKTQHGTVHRLEDEIARLRAALGVVGEETDDE